jgi:hypothetical protein
LTERSGGDLYTLGVAVLGMPGSCRAPGAKCLDVIEFEPVAVKEKLVVDGERRVTNRKNEAVAADPLVVAWVVTHNFVEEQVSDRSQADRGSRVAIANLFNGVCCEYSRGVYSFGIKVGPLEC